LTGSDRSIVRAGGGGRTLLVESLQPASPPARQPASPPASQPASQPQPRRPSPPAG